MWYVFTSEVFFNWNKLRAKLKEFYGLKDIEVEYLSKKILNTFMHKIGEEEIVQDFRVWLKRNFYEEMHLMLDLELLRILGELFENHNLILITNLKKYPLVFKEHTMLFTKIFSPQEYNKKIDDIFFAKIVHAYLYKEVKGDVSQIRIFSSQEQVCKNFKTLNFLTKCVNANSLKKYFLVR